MRRGKAWHPLLAVFYLTYRCDFRCHYCSDGTRTPYYRLSANHLPGPDVLMILAKIRRYTPYVVITGGEPLAHPDLSFILKQLPRLKFRDVVLTTNGHQMQRHLPEIAGAISSLVVSMDTLDPIKADAINGTPSGTFERIRMNLALADRLGRGQYRIFISSVVTPANIPDLYGVYEFCKAKRYVFAACPQLNGVDPHPALRENEDYRRFFDFLIQEKRKGGLIHGTLPYLAIMRDLAKFNCRPFTMLTVSPEGNVFYPCLEIGRIAGNLLQVKNLHCLRQAAEKQFGPPPDCGNQCHSACALGFSVLLEQPAAIWKEGLLFMKRRVQSFTTRSA